MTFTRAGAIPQNPTVHMERIIRGKFIRMAIDHHLIPGAV